MTIEGLVIAGGMVAGIYGVKRWLSSPHVRTPDPWGPEVEQIIQNPQTPALCHRCLLPIESETCWFCPECGAASGQFNNYMPYVDVFSEGEVLRAGVGDRMKPTPLIIIGYVLYTSSLYIVFAPIYWVLLFRNLKRHTAASAQVAGGERGNGSAKI